MEQQEADLWLGLEGAAREPGLDSVWGDRVELWVDRVNRVILGVMDAVEEVEWVVHDLMVWFRRR
jgi:hypothetical protein